MAQFCTKCGTQRSNSARFCSQCGAAYADPAAPAAPQASPYVPPASPYVPPANGMAVPAAEPVATDTASGGPNPLLIGGVALAALVIAGVAWWSFSDLPVNGIEPKKGTTAASSAASPSTDATTTPAYTDSYLTQADEAMVTRGPVAVLAVPGESTAPPLRSLPENATLTGRWVRGTDGTSRWFRVASGGYLPAAAVVAPTAAAPVRARFFDLDAAFANTLNSYFNAAQAEHERALELAQKKGGDEVAANGFAAVPSRSMHGLTVTGVGSHWESSTIMFRENVATVRAALQAEGWRVAGDGTIETSPQEAATCSIGPTSQWPEFARYGATVLSCGL